MTVKTTGNKVDLMRTLFMLLCSVLVMSIMQHSFAQKTMVENGSDVKKRKIGDPLSDLPDNIEVLTLFGERADISPDNKQVAFMAKTFGDAMVVDVATRKISCLTCNIPAASFVRVMHLVTGDYLLIGPAKFENSQASKRNNDLWFLSREPGSTPAKIGQRVSEGVAVSKNSL